MLIFLTSENIEAELWKDNHNDEWKSFNFISETEPNWIRTDSKSIINSPNNCKIYQKNLYKQKINGKNLLITHGNCYQTHCTAEHRWTLSNLNLKNNPSLNDIVTAVNVKLLYSDIDSKWNYNTLQIIGDVLINSNIDICYDMMHYFDSSYITGHYNPELFSEFDNEIDIKTINKSGKTQLSENKYNERMHKKNSLSLSLYDCKTKQYDGIEIADLIDEKNGIFYIIKRYIINQLNYDTEIGFVPVK